MYKSNFYLFICFIIYRFYYLSFMSF